ncbi:MAG: hypothetical protein KF693_18500 [Nitrospira sp.]|nr:hypothetical protein [Nitrospira sp.]
MTKEVLERQESCREESLGETTALGMEAVLDGLDPPVHEPTRPPTCRPTLFQSVRALSVLRIVPHSAMKKRIRVIL